MRIKDETFIQNVEKLEKLKTRLAEHGLNKHPKKEEYLEMYAKKSEVRGD